MKKSKLLTLFALLAFTALARADTSVPFVPLAELMADPSAYVEHGVRTRGYWFRRDEDCVFLPSRDYRRTPESWQKEFSIDFYEPLADPQSVSLLRKLGEAIRQVEAKKEVVVIEVEIEGTIKMSPVATSHNILRVSRLLFYRVIDERPNKALVPMHMSVTPAASHPSRQPYASAHL